MHQPGRSQQCRGRAGETGTLLLLGVTHCRLGLRLMPGNYDCYYHNMIHLLLVRRLCSTHQAVSSRPGPDTTRRGQAGVRTTADTQPQPHCTPSFTLLGGGPTWAFSFLKVPSAFTLKNLRIFAKPPVVYDLCTLSKENAFSGHCDSSTAHQLALTCTIASTS